MISGGSRGWYRFNRLVRVRNAVGLTSGTAAKLVLSVNEKVEISVTKREEEWDGFKQFEFTDYSSPVVDSLPTTLWFRWMRRWYIRGSTTRVGTAQVDFLWVLPDFIMLRGEKMEVDRVYYALKSVMCKQVNLIRLETIPFDFVWFLWLFENAPASIGGQLQLKAITDIRLTGGDEGYEGREMREYRSADITKSLFSAVALLLRRDIVGVTCEMELGTGTSSLKVSASIVSGEDAGVKPTHECEEMKIEKPTRGAIYLEGALTSNDQLNEQKLIIAVLICSRLVVEYEQWRMRTRTDRVPTDRLADKLLKTVEDSIEDIKDQGPRRLKEWLAAQRGG
jgi:hypothetical protein